MTSNLPPGVTESMIPGNRPEDLWFDTFMAALVEKVPGSFSGAFDPEILARVVGEYLTALDIAYTSGMRDGVNEAAMAIQEAVQHD